MAEHGLKCPECSFLIKITPDHLLAGRPVYCNSCGLKLTIDQEKSQECLKGLGKIMDAIDNAKKVRSRWE